VSFVLYGPDDATCSTPVFTDPAVPYPQAANAVVQSAPFTPQDAGTYRWIATYSGDAKNESKSTACGDPNESSVVNKTQPGLTTTATASVTIGDPITDTASLTGATANAGGTITFHLFSDSLCQNEVSTGLTPVSVSGNGDYNSGPFTPTVVGSYYWTAVYSGDDNNLSQSTSCGDPLEQSDVNKAPPSIDTAQTLTPQDSATISASAGGTATGSVTFELFGPNDTTCSGPAVYTESDVALDSNGSASTSNSSVSVSSANADTYRWKVVYSGDSTHEGTTSACGTEQFTLTIANS